MQNQTKHTSLKSKISGQGAIEYLLIIGAAILVVAIVIIGLGGLLNVSKDSTNTDSTAYTDSLLDLKYEQIGFPISIKPGEHTSFTLAIQPTNNLLPEVFSDAPEGTIVTINYENTYTKLLNNWSGNGDTARINQGNILDIFVPQTATSPLNLTIKGNYTSIQPRKIIFDCNENITQTLTATIPFEPKEKNAKIVFKDFFNTAFMNSALFITDFQSNFYYLGEQGCEGTLCIQLNEQTCGESPDYCYWDSSENQCINISSFTCSDFDAWLEGCTNAGCSISDEPKILDYSATNGEPVISVGSSVSISCMPQQVIHAEIEELVSANFEYIEQLSLSPSTSKTFLLKNYQCYTFEKLYNKLIPDILLPLNNTSSGGSIDLYCQRGPQYAHYNYYKSSWSGWSDGYKEDPSNMNIYQDTICSISAEHAPATPIELTC